MPRIEVEVEEMSFEFLSEADWVANAHAFFRRSCLTSESAICVDTLGRICIKGKEFKRAEVEGTYPIRVYAIPAYRDQA
jgi:hypothetical protein